MLRKRFTEEQIARALRPAHAGTPVRAINTTRPDSLPRTTFCDRAAAEVRRNHGPARRSFAVFGRVGAIRYASAMAYLSL